MLQQGIVKADHVMYYLSSSYTWLSMTLGGADGVYVLLLCIVIELSGALYVGLL